MTWWTKTPTSSPAYPPISTSEAWSATGMRSLTGLACMGSAKSCTTPPPTTPWTANSWPRAALSATWMWSAGRPSASSGPIWRRRPSAATRWEKRCPLTGGSSRWWVCSSATPNLKCSLAVGTIKFTCLIPLLWRSSVTGGWACTSSPAPPARPPTPPKG